VLAFIVQKLRLSWDIYEITVLIYLNIKIKVQCTMKCITIVLGYIKNVKILTFFGM
jgi:hypothetical protein